MTQKMCHINLDSNKPEAALRSLLARELEILVAGFRNENCKNKILSFGVN